MLSYSNNIVQEDMLDIYDEKILFNKLRNKSVLITGATGMLATYIIYFLYYLNQKRDSNIKIYALARNIKKAENLFTDLIDDKNFNNKSLKEKSKIMSYVPQITSSFDINLTVFDMVLLGRVPHKTFKFT